MLDLARESLYANLWVVRARWFYASAALILGFLALYDKSRTFDQVLPTNILLGLFAVTLVGNGLFYIWGKAIEKRNSYTTVTLLAVLQVVFELTILSIIMFAVAQFKTIVPVLFFIPIVESIVLFDRIGPAVVAAVSSILINAILFIGIYLFPVGPGEAWALFLTNTAPITVVYMIIGFFASSMAHLLKGRGEIMVAQNVEQSHHVVELEKLNRKLEAAANQLYSKDLELTLANQRLEKLEEAKSKFIAVTTHQLRTPLAAVKWTFDMAVKEELGPLNADQKEFLQKGYDSAQRIIKIVNQLLNAGSFDKVATEKLNYQPEQMLDVINSVAFEFTNQAESKKIELKVVAPPRPLPLLEVDHEKIRMVFENLIDNAIKYSPKGGAVTITIDDAKINTANPSVEFVVADSGIGIPPEDQTKIFAKFYRASNAVSVEPDGTGLGLFIGRDIIERHHGTLRFDSAVGKGTTFHVSLPVNQPKNN